MTGSLTMRVSLSATLARERFQRRGFCRFPSGNRRFRYALCR
ncbi:hypothetical protein CKA32_005491 [Geitlerinema sp. FC II]|nr:hypothetical protein CKA32_005491 [Geitlerinema sp. FC II]